MIFKLKYSMRIKFYLLLFFLSVFFITRLFGQKNGLLNTSESKYSKMHNVDMNSVTFTNGFWKERFTICKDSMVPFMWSVFNDAERSHSFRNFEIASGLFEGEHNGPAFHDGDFYKWLEGAVSIYAITKEAELDKLLDYIISVIGKAQRADGYIHTPVIISRKNNPDAPAEFAERMDFETYNLGHLMTAGAVHYRVTGKTNLLDIAIKSADFLYVFYETASADLARNAICPSHYMGVTEMYRTTKNPRYLELAKNLIEIRSLVTNGADHNQDRVPFREQEEVMGHAVRANYLYAGVADVILETGDETLLEPLNKIWEDLVSSKIYITGGCGPLYDGVSPDGTTYDQPYIQQIHQAYARPYQLPNLTAHNESCANIGNMLWNWRMLQISGEAKYAHWLEQTLYNSILSAVSLDGKRFFYTNPLSVNHDVPFELRWSKDREEYISHCNCCPPNVVRTVAQVNNYIYSISDNSVWCHLFADNDFKTKLPNGEVVEISQKTDYPWDGLVEFTIKKAPKNDFSLKIRIPEWAENSTISVNGKEMPKPAVGEYFELSQKWKKGDKIDLDMPMRTRMIQTNPLVEETRNQIAVQRGPVVYCIESPDIPEGYRIFDFAISEDALFKPVDIVMDNSKIKALEVDAIVIGDKENKALYSELKPKNSKVQKTIRLVPYYSWNNRGVSEMSVWIPVR